MKLSKLLSILLFVTAFSLLYVFQQTEVYRFAYAGQKREAILQDLLDKNTILRYNIGRFSSLVEFGKRISDSVQFQMPESYRLVRVMPLEEGGRLAARPANRQTLLSRIFGIKRQAEAQTINP